MSAWRRGVAQIKLAIASSSPGSKDLEKIPVKLHNTNKKKHDNVSPTVTGGRGEKVTTDHTKVSLEAE